MSIEDDKTIQVVSVEEENFQSLLKSIYNILFQYEKDYKDPESWVASYSEILGIKFPSMNYNEGYRAFSEKLTKILDLMELTHLYCKITNPKLYHKENHASIVSCNRYIAQELNELTQSRFEELMQHLKYVLLFGNN